MNFWRFLLAGALLSCAAGLVHANAPLVQQDTQAGGAGSAAAEAEGEESLAVLDQRIEELRNQMALAMAEVERVNRERAELLARLDDLDARIVLARQTVDSRQQQFAQLRANVAAGAEPPSQPEGGQAAASSEAESGAPRPNSGLNPVVVGIGLALLALALLALRLLRQGRDETEEPPPAAVGTADIGDSAAPAAVAAERASRSDTASAPETEIDPQYTTSPGEDEREGEREYETDEFEGETFRIEPGRVEPGRIEPAVEAESAATDAATMIGETSPEQELEATARDDSDPPPAEDAPAGEDEYVIDLDNGDSEEIAERLNLAYSFHRMGDSDQARRILEQVIRVGNEAQVGEARQLLAIIHDLD